MFKYYDPLNSNSNCAEHWWTNINFIHNLFENPHRNQSSEIPNIQIKSCKNVCKLFNKTKIWRKLPLRKSCLEYYSYLFNTILIYLLLFVPLGIIYISFVYLKQTTLNGCPYINSIYIRILFFSSHLKENGSESYNSLASGMNPLSLVLIREYMITEYPPKFIKIKSLETI